MHQRNQLNRVLSDLSVSGLYFVPRYIVDHMSSYKNKVVVVGWSSVMRLLYCRQCRRTVLRDSRNIANYETRKYENSAANQIRVLGFSMTWSATLFLSSWRILVLLGFLLSFFTGINCLCADSWCSRKIKPTNAPQQLRARGRFSLTIGTWTASSK